MLLFCALPLVIVSFGNNYLFCLRVTDTPNPRQTCGIGTNPTWKMKRYVADIYRHTYLESVFYPPSLSDCFDI